MILGRDMNGRPIHTGDRVKCQAFAGKTLIAVTSHRPGPLYRSYFRRDERLLVLNNGKRIRCKSVQLDTGEPTGSWEEVEAATRWRPSA